MNKDNRPECRGEREEKLYQADIAKEKLIQLMKPEYSHYIEKRLAGDFACALMGVIESCHTEQPEGWETVEQWEERTGEEYPNDGPVWEFWGNMPIHGSPFGHTYALWRIKLWANSKMFPDHTSVIPLPGKGRPPEEIG